MPHGFVNGTVTESPNMLTFYGHEYLHFVTKRTICIQSNDHPTMNLDRWGLKQWLENKKVSYPQDATKVELYDLCIKNISRVEYELDNYVAHYTQHEIVRIPPKNTKYNAIEQAWEAVKDQVKKRGDPDVVSIENTKKIWSKAVNFVTPALWKRYCQSAEQVILEEYNRISNSSNNNEPQINSVTEKDTKVQNQNIDRLIRLKKVEIKQQNLCDKGLRDKPPRNPEREELLAQIQMMQQRLIEMESTEKLQQEMQSSVKIIPEAHETSKASSEPQLSIRSCPMIPEAMDAVSERAPNIDINPDSSTVVDIPEMNMDVEPETPFSISYEAPSNPYGTKCTQIYI